MVLSPDSKNIPIRGLLIEYLIRKWEEDREKFPDKTHKKFGGYLNDKLEEFVSKLKYLEIFTGRQYFTWNGYPVD